MWKSAGPVIVEDNVTRAGIWGTRTEEGTLTASSHRHMKRIPLLTEVKIHELNLSIHERTHIPFKWKMRVLGIDRYFMQSSTCQNTRASNLFLAIRSFKVCGMQNLDWDHKSTYCTKMFSALRIWLQEQTTKK